MLGDIRIQFKALSIITKEGLITYLLDFAWIPV